MFCIILKYHSWEQEVEVIHSVIVCLFYYVYTLCSNKKWTTKLIAVTLSNLN